MARTKATVRRLNQPNFVAAPGERIVNKNIMNRRNSTLKLKTLLPQTLRVKVKKINKSLEEWTSRGNGIISRETEGCSFKMDYPPSI